MICIEDTEYGLGLMRVYIHVYCLHYFWYAYCADLFLIRTYVGTYGIDYTEMYGV